MTDRAKQRQALDFNHRDNTPRETTLAAVAADVAIRAAAEYLRVRVPGLAVDYGRLSESLRRHVTAALPQAMADAQAAFECHMESVGNQTFYASMRLAGIAAAKEVAA